MSTQPFISIIIPVYNDEKFLSKCINSIINQTLEQIEIICINDASTDKSLDILTEYKNMDSRITIINYDENKSASQARKDGVLSSNGNYIMFVDADDWLELNACEKLYELINKENVEILNFGTNIVINNNVEKNRILSLENFLNVTNNRYSGKEVFEQCFVYGKYKWNLWNKIFKATVCKKAFAAIKDGYYPKAQDMLAYFFISFFANSYMGIEDKYYNYNYGCGITGSNDICINDFERFCHQAYIPELIKEFLCDNDAFDEYFPVYDNIKKKMVRECVFNWDKGLSDKNKAAGYDIMVKYCGLENTVSFFQEKYNKKMGYIAEKIEGAEKLKTSSRKVKTIATYYHRMGNGGIQKVISQLIPLWLNSGYEKVILLTDEKPTEEDYKLPKCVERIIMPNYFEIKKGDYIKRAEFISKIVKEEDIDIIIYHAFASKILLWDVCMFKGNNVPVLLCTHNIFSYFLTYGKAADYKTYVERPPIFRLCNIVTVLSKTDELYYRLQGVNTVYIPNPVFNEICDMKQSDLRSKTVVWVGRTSATKRPEEAINIFKKVVEQIPDAKLNIVGKCDEQTENELKNMIILNNLQDNVELCGYHIDVSPFYENASVFLSTATFEGFPLTGIEFMSHGLPGVLYEMPYLEMYKNVDGCIQVKQMDSDSAAREIVKLLTDYDYRKECGKSCYNQAIKFSQFDYSGTWKFLIDSTAENRKINNKDIDIDEARIIFDTLNTHLLMGNANVVERQKNAVANAMEKGEKSGEEKIKSTKSYRLGERILYLPKKIKKVILHN